MVSNVWPYHENITRHQWFFSALVWSHSYFESQLKYPGYIKQWISTNTQGSCLFGVLADWRKRRSGPQAKPEECDYRGDAHLGNISDPTADHYLNYMNTRTVFNVPSLSFASCACAGGSLGCQRTEASVFVCMQPQMICLCLSVNTN